MSGVSPEAISGTGITSTAVVSRSNRRTPAIAVLRRVRPGRISAIWQGALLALTFAVAAYYTLKTNRDFWYDEAMLVLAIRHEGWLPPWQPMAIFEQSTPYGVYVIQKSVLSLVGFSTNVLRIPGLIVAAIGGFATWRTGRLLYGGTAAFFAALVAIGSVFVVQEAGDFKQYVFEYTSAAVVAYLGARALKSGVRVRATVTLFAVAIVLLLFSNTIVLVTAAVAVTVLAGSVLGPERPSRVRVVVFGIAAAVYLVIFAAWYLLVARPASSFQLAYPTYSQISGLQGYAGIVQNVTQPTVAYFVQITTFAAVGLVVAAFWRRRLLPAFAFAAVAILGGAAALALGAAPFSAERQILFLVPLIGIATGAAVRTIWSVLSTAIPAPQQGRRLVIGGLAIVVTAGMIWTIKPNAVIQRQQVGTALALYSSSCPAFWIDWWAQPAATLYAERLGISSHLHGLVSTASGKGQDAWAYRVIDHPAAYQTAMVRYVKRNPSTCVMIGTRPDEVGLVLTPLADAHLTCTRFAALADTQLYRCARKGTA